VALPAFARRSQCYCAPCCCGVRRPPRTITMTVSPARRNHSSKPAAAACGGLVGQRDGQTDRQTDGWKPGSCIDVAPHTKRAVPLKRCMIKLLRTGQHHRFNFILLKAINSHYFSYTAVGFIKMMIVAFFCQFCNFFVILFRSFVFFSFSSLFSSFPHCSFPFYTVFLDSVYEQFRYPDASLRSINQSINLFI